MAGASSHPSGMHTRDYLTRYCQVFNAVEVDSTFYGTPRQETVKRWTSLTPERFSFSPKVPRQITHDKRLTGISDLLAIFLDTMRLFGERLGRILIQLPPDFSRSEIEVLADFLSGLPADMRFAVEFRHRSWHARETGELLQAHNICWASTEYLYLPHRVYVTTDFVYIRWIGRHGVYERHDRERLDRTSRLQEWAFDIQSRTNDGIRSVHGFFNNDYAGFAPATCQKFQEIVGLPTQQLAPQQQGRLF